MHRLKKGVLIVFEGIDGAGKSTQARLLYERLTKAQFNAELSKEPTEGRWGKKLRKLIEEGRGEVSPQEELELFIKDRFQHVEEIINPGLENNKIIILDRYYFSTIAYQGALGVDPREIEKKNSEFAPAPNLLFLIEIPPAAGIRRIKESRGKETDSFERESYLLRVGQIFQSLDRPFLYRLSGEESVQKLSDQTWGKTMAYLKDHNLIER
jgi:dTMP kinase